MRRVCSCACWPQGDTALLNKYKQSHLESYMEDNQRVAFCPSVPWCGRAVEVRSHAVVTLLLCCVVLGAFAMSLLICGQRSAVRYGECACWQPLQCASQFM